MKFTSVVLIALFATAFPAQLPAAEETTPTIPAPSDAVPAGWGTDYAKARQTAKEKNLPILIFFTGSDWCPPCKMLDKNVVSKKEFTEYLAKNVIPLYADYPRQREQSDAQKRHNAMLASQFKIEAFPTMVLLNPPNFRPVRLNFNAGNATVKTMIKEIDAKKKTK